MTPSLVDRVLDAIAGVEEAVADAVGVDAARLAVRHLRSVGGDDTYPSVYQMHGGRLWVIALAGYTGVFDGIGLERGVMATAALTGEVQFVADALERPDFLHAQGSFRSEVTVPVRGLVFNLETTEPMDDSVIEPFERMARFVADRVFSGEDPLVWERSIALALGPMVSLGDAVSIAEYACRLTARHLDLEFAQLVLFDGQEPVVVSWRTPESLVTEPDPAALRSLIESKRAYLSWRAAASEMIRGWPADRDAIVLTFSRRGEMVGGLIGVGSPGTGTSDQDRKVMAAVCAHTIACLDRVRLEEALLGALDARRKFIASVSHELRTPLTAIVGFSEILRSGDVGEAEEAEYLQAVTDSASHLLAVVTDLLDMAKAEAGQLTVGNGDRVEMGALSRSVATQLGTQAERASTTVVVQGDEAIHIRGDELRIRQILLNLLTNAIKFTPGGTVTVTARAGDGYGVVTVADDGAGIDPDLLPTLFQPFTGRSVFDPASGTGLGLVISRRLAEAMGGGLELDSPGSGRGAIATLWLPLDESA